MLITQIGLFFDLKVQSGKAERCCALYHNGKDVAATLGYAKPENAIAIHVDKEDKKQYPDSGEWFELQVKGHPHQRERSLFSDSLFEASAGQGVQALGDLGGTASDPTDVWIACVSYMGG